MEWGPGQPELVGGSPAHGRGWHWVGFELPSNLNRSVILTGKGTGIEEFLPGAVFIPDISLPSTHLTSADVLIKPSAGNHTQHEVPDTQL